MKKAKKRRKRLAIVLSILVAIGSLYSLFVFSNNATIKKWRDLYIETAMSTMTHQWLATYFIPKYIVDDVVARAEKQLKDNIINSSKILDDSLISKSELAYRDKYREVDFKKAGKFLDDKEGKIVYGEGKLKTTVGDNVYLIDDKNNILIVEFQRPNFLGKLAIIKDSSQVQLAINRNPNRGSTVNELVKAYDAILGVNGSGFIDPNWSSNGLNPAGLVLSKGVVYKGNAKNPFFQTVGFDHNDNLVMGKRIDNKNLRDAVEFKPIIVLNGRAAVEGSLGLGIQPRTAIGQNNHKEAMLLMIEGRMPGYSLGATMGDMAKLMLQYDCFNGMNMDGGSSSVMVYDGKEITKNCTGYTQGRTIPTAWVVLKGKTKER